MRLVKDQINSVCSPGLACGKLKILVAASFGVLICPHAGTMEEIHSFIGTASSTADLVLGHDGGVSRHNLQWRTQRCWDGLSRNDEQAVDNGGVLCRHEWGKSIRSVVARTGRDLLRSDVQRRVTALFQAAVDFLASCSDQPAGSTLEFAQWPGLGGFGLAGGT
jgi:hypothetical protein